MRLTDVLLGEEIPAGEPEWTVPKSATSPETTEIDHKATPISGEGDSTVPPLRTIATEGFVDDLLEAPLVVKVNPDRIRIGRQWPCPFCLVNVEQKLMVPHLKGHDISPEEIAQIVPSRKAEAHLPGKDAVVYVSEGKLYVKNESGNVHVGDLHITDHENGSWCPIEHAITEFEKFLGDEQESDYDEIIGADQQPRPTFDTEGNEWLKMTGWRKTKKEAGTPACCVNAYKIAKPTDPCGCGRLRKDHGPAGECPDYDDTFYFKHCVSCGQHMTDPSWPYAICGNHGGKKEQAMLPFERTLMGEEPESYERMFGRGAFGSFVGGGKRPQTYAIARGQDAGNRSMKKAGRTAWSIEDFDVASTEAERINAQLLDPHNLSAHMAPTYSGKESFERMLEVELDWGKEYGSTRYRLPDGQIVSMHRKGQKVRFFNIETGEQVGPEQPNVAPAMAYAAAHRWWDMGASAGLNLAVWREGTPKKENINVLSQCKECGHAEHYHFEGPCIAFGCQCGKFAEAFLPFEKMLAEAAGDWWVQDSSAIDQSCAVCGKSIYKGESIVRSNTGEVRCNSCFRKLGPFHHTRTTKDGRAVFDEEAVVNEMANTLVALKTKFPVGSKFRCLKNTYRPEAEGHLRTVVKVQGNGLYYTMEGTTQRQWMPFPERVSDIVSSDGNSVTWYMGTHGKSEGHTLTMEFPRVNESVGGTPSDECSCTHLRSRHRGATGCDDCDCKGFTGEKATKFDRFEPEESKMLSFERILGETPMFPEPEWVGKLNANLRRVWKGGQFNCPVCSTMIGMNLRGEVPHLYAMRHIESDHPAQADSIKRGNFVALPGSAAAGMKMEAAPEFGQCSLEKRDTAVADVIAQALVDLKKLPQWTDDGASRVTSKLRTSVKRTNRGGGTQTTLDLTSLTGKIYKATQEAFERILGEGDVVNLPQRCPQCGHSENKHEYDDATNRYHCTVCGCSISGDAEVESKQLSFERILGEEGTQICKNCTHQEQMHKPGGCFACKTNKLKEVCSNYVPEGPTLRMFAGKVTGEAREVFTQGVPGHGKCQWYVGSIGAQGMCGKTAQRVVFKDNNDSTYLCPEHLKALNAGRKGGGLLPLKGEAEGFEQKILGALNEALPNATVGTFLMVLDSMLTQWDVQINARDTKRRIPVNHHRLALFLEASAHVKQACASVLNRDDAEAMAKLKSAIADAFDADAPPVKKTFKQIDAWLTSKKNPTLVGGFTEAEGLGELGVTSGLVSIGTWRPQNDGSYKCLLCGKVYNPAEKGGEFLPADAATYMRNHRDQHYANATQDATGRFIFKKEGFERTMLTAINEAEGTFWARGRCTACNHFFPAHPDGGACKECDCKKYTSAKTEGEAFNRSMLMATPLPTAKRRDRSDRWTVEDLEDFRWAVGEDVNPRGYSQCPECETSWRNKDLKDGKLPPHKFNDKPCPGSGQVGESTLTEVACPRCVIGDHGTNKRDDGVRHMATGKKVPSVTTMMKWSSDGVAKATDGCRVEPDGRCPHGHSSWMLRLGMI